MLTWLTGVYPNDHGIADANEYQYYWPNGLTDEAGSFSYWTDPVDSFSTANGLGTDSNYNILDAAVQNARLHGYPSPGRAATSAKSPWADLDLENSVPDASVVFGPNSPEANLRVSRQVAVVICSRGYLDCC